MGGVWEGASTPHCLRPAVRGQKLSAATGIKVTKSHGSKPLSPPRASCEPAGQMHEPSHIEGLGAPVMGGPAAEGPYAHVRTLDPGLATPSSPPRPR